MLGAPMDLSNGIRNIAVRGINYIAGTSIPQTDAVGGSADVKRAFGIVGANPDNVVAATPTESLVRSATEGATMALAPELGGAALVGTGLATAGKVAPVVEKLGGLTAGNVAAGAASGVGANAAAALAPDAWKPVAGVAGGLVGGGVGGLTVAGAKSAGNALTGLGDSMGLSTRNALSDASGTVLRDTAGNPVTATDAQAAAAGQRIQAAASDPQAVRDALDTPTVTSLPASPATTYQVTGDRGLGDLERGISQGDNRPFLDLAAQQNKARVDALNGVVPDTASPADAAAVVRQQQAAQDSTQQGGVDQARSNLNAAMGQLGGVPASSDSATALQDLGQRLRSSLDAPNQAAKANVTKLADAIDPDGTLGVDMTPIRARAQSIAQAISPNAAQPVGAEADILNTAANLPAVQPFRDLAALRENITNTIRGARSDPARGQEVRRLSMLLDGVHDAMDGAANSPDVAIPPATTVAAPATASAAPGIGSDVFTPSGQRVGVRYGLAEADDLVTSHGPDMTPNPAYPPEMQPRDRGRAASQVQVANIASRLQPERLGASTSVTDGAPIIGPDGIVESGNGRVMALRQAYQAGGLQSQAYRDWLGTQGHDVSGMSKPILVRVRSTPMAPEQRVAFAAEGNTPTTLAMSATERAAQDAGRLPNNVLRQFQSSDVTDPANREAVRGFVRNVVEPGQEGAFATADGQLSQEGAARVRAALVHRAYGDQGISAALAETTDPAAKVLTGAMQDAAAPMAKLRAGIQAGDIDPAVDLAPSLVEAAQTVAQARQRGISLADQVAQRDMLGGGTSPQAARLLRAAYGPDLTGRMSQDQFSKLLGDYASRASEQSTAPNLFGANLTADQLLEGSEARYGKANAGGGQSVNATPARPVDGPFGDRSGGSVPGPRGQATPGGSGGEGGQTQGPSGSRILQQPASALTANFDRAAADRYAAMRGAHRDRMSTYGPGVPGVGPVLAPGPTSGSFALDASKVPGQLIKAGPGAAERVQAFLRAGGSPADIADAAAYDFRSVAENADGTLNSARAAAWQKSHSELLAALPEFRNRLDTATGAQDALDSAAAAQTEARKAFDTSAAGKLIGTENPKAVVASVLGDKRGGQVQMRQLAAATASDPAARAGLQRIVVDHIFDQMQGDKLAGQTGTTQLYGAKLQKFVRQNAGALGEVMTPQQMRVLHDVAADIQRSDQSISGNVLPGNSTTIQNEAAGNRVSVGGTLLDHLRRQGVETMVGSGAGGAVGGALGSMFGPVGAWMGTAAGGAAGGVAGKVASSLKAANIATVDDLVKQAALNPGLARALLSKVTPETAPNVGRALAAQLRQSVVIGGAVGDRRAQAAAPAPQAGNPLGRVAAGSVAPVRSNALAGLGR